MKPSAFLLIALLLPRAAYAAELVARPLAVIRTLPHSGYSEGLDFKDGFLWHALPKESVKIDPKDGRVVARFPSSSDYNESLAWVGEELLQLSFADNGIYRGRLKGATLSFERAGTVPEVHGWGITYDGKNVIITGDYSRKLYFLDLTSLRVVRTIETPVDALEDLAWDGTGIWSSSFTTYQGTIFRFDPRNGKLQGAFALSAPQRCPVIDGIAVDGDTLWLTGKHCPELFQVANPFGRSVAGKK